MEAQKSNGKTYAEKLKDPRWQRLRLEVFQRDDFACTQCGATDKPLHCHHIHYVWGREPWDYSIDDLLTVCADCHERLTDDAKGFKAVLADLLTSGEVDYSSLVTFLITLCFHPICIDDVNRMLSVLYQVQPGDARRLFEEMIQAAEGLPKVGAKAVEVADGRRLD